MLEAFVTNLGRYNEGYLDGKPLKLPATTEEVQALLKHIHVDGVRYEKIFITNYETDISDLRDCLGEYESIDELNYLASLLEDLEEWEVEKFAAAVDFGEYNSVPALINLTQNLDCFEFTPELRMRKIWAASILKKCVR
nr:antirestriction protein ArdA [Lachnoclostridium phytofermentans]